MSAMGGHTTDYCSIINLLLFKAIARGATKKWTHEERLHDLLIQLQHLRRAERLHYTEENYSAMVKTFWEAERLQGNWQGRLGCLYSPLREDIFPPQGQQVTSSHESHQMRSATGQQPCTGSSPGGRRAGASCVSSDMRSMGGGLAWASISEASTNSSPMPCYHITMTGRKFRSFFQLSPCISYSVKEANSWCANISSVRCEPSTLTHARKTKTCYRVLLPKYFCNGFLVLISDLKSFGKRWVSIK